MDFILMVHWNGHIARPCGCDTCGSAQCVCPVMAGHGRRHRDGALTTVSEERERRMRVFRSVLHVLYFTRRKRERERERSSLSSSLCHTYGQALSSHSPVKLLRSPCPWPTTRFIPPHPIPFIHTPASQPTRPDGRAGHHVCSHARRRWRHRPEQAVRHAAGPRPHHRTGPQGPHQAALRPRQRVLPEPLVTPLPPLPSLPTHTS